MILCHMGFAHNCHAGCCSRVAVAAAAAAAAGGTAVVVVADKVVKEVRSAIESLRMGLESSVEVAESFELSHLPCVRQERLVGVYSWRYLVVRWSRSKSTLCSHLELDFHSPCRSVHSCELVVPFQQIL